MWLKELIWCQRNSMFLTHSTSRSNSVVWRLIQSCHVFFCAARDDRRLVVESLLCVSAFVPFSVILRVDAHSAMARLLSSTRHVVSWSLVCSYFSPCLDMYHGSGDSLVWRWILRCMNLRLVLWTRQDRERFYVSSVYLVINTELCQSTEYRIWTQISWVHSPENSTLLLNLLKKLKDFFMTQRNVFFEKIKYDLKNWTFLLHYSKN